MVVRVGSNNPRAIGQPAAADVRPDAKVEQRGVERATSTPPRDKTRFDAGRAKVTREELAATTPVQQRGIYEGEAIEAERVTLRNAIWQRLETPSSLNAPKALRSIDLPALASSLNEVTSQRQAKRLETTAQQSQLAATLIDDVLSNTSGLAKDVRASLLQSLTSDLLGPTGVLVAGITSSPGFTSLSGVQKAQLASVVSRLEESGLAVFAALLESVPEALSDQDALGNTLLSNLATLAEQPLNTSLVGVTTTEEVLRGVLTDVMNPNRIDCGEASACTVASMQFELVADDPAEYARLLSGLVSAKGTSSMRGGGALRLGPGDADPTGRAARSVSQSIFQSAALEYANGRFANYDPVTGVSTVRRTGQTAELKPEHQQALLEKLFGVRYSIDRLFSEAEATKAIAKLDGWDARGFQNRPIIVDLDQGKFNFGVTLESVSGGRVVFRDPFGVLRSMATDAFPKVAVAVHLPTDVKLHGV